MRYKNILIILAVLVVAAFSGRAFAATYTYDNANRLLSVDYGNGTLVGYTYDDAGNMLSMAVSDTAPPSGSITINNGEASTTSAAVTLNLTATDNSGAVARMRLSNDGVAWTGWEAYAAGRAWTLTSGDGVKTVYAQYDDATGNVSAAYTDTITLDTGMLDLLTVGKAGTGGGTITSVPAGIDCGADCSEIIAPGTVVTLTAAPDADSAFIEWAGGGCAGGGDCVMTMNADESVTAAFDALPPVAAFSGTPVTGMTPLLVSFTDASSHASSWLWDFGDSTTSTERNPSHLYTGVGTYTVTLTAGNAVGSDGEIKTAYIDVQACNLPVRIEGAAPVYYPTLQAAYDAAVDGDVIKAQAVSFTADLIANRNVSVTLDGGYDCGYTTKPGKTVLNGNLDVTAGTLEVSDVDLQ